MHHIKISKDLIAQYLDVKNLIRRLQEIDKLKLILLTKNQRKLFEMIPKLKQSHLNQTITESTFLRKKNRNFTGDIGEIDGQENITKNILELLESTRSKANINCQTQLGKKSIEDEEMSSKFFKYFHKKPNKNSWTGRST